MGKTAWLKECLEKVSSVGKGGQGSPRARGMSLPPMAKARGNTDETEVKKKETKDELLEEEDD